MKEEAKEIYEMGKKLCELAESMGYEEEGESEEKDDGFGPESAPIGASKKMDMAMALFNEK